MTPPRQMTTAEFLDSGESYGRERCAADAAVWLAKVDETPALEADLMTWFAYFEEKARPLALAADQARAKGVAFPWWYDAVKRGYQEAVCEVVTDQIQAWKKRALVGKMHFARTVKFMPMASHVLVFRGDFPVDASYENSIRVMLHGLAEVAGLKVPPAAA